MKRDRLLNAFMMFAVLAGLAAWLLWSSGRDRRAIARMDEPDRHALFAKTWDAYSALCTEGRRGFEKYCGDQAQFLRLFPECDVTCRDSTGEFLGGGATR